LLATLFLALPYLLMLWLDIRTGRENRRIEQMARRLETTFSNQKTTDRS
jgi:hypothetical protein